MGSHAADRRTPAADGAMEWYGSQYVLGYYGSGWPADHANTTPSCPVMSIVCLSSTAGRIQHHESSRHVAQLAISATIRYLRAVLPLAASPPPLPPPGPYHSGTAPCPEGTVPYSVCVVSPQHACRAAVSAFLLREHLSLFSRVQTASLLTHSTFSFVPGHARPRLLSFGRPASS